VGKLDAFVEWAREAAVHFDGLDGDTDPEPLSRVLEPLLAGKRVVYLGEPDHWVQQKTAYRSLFLRYLAARGWRWIGEEFGWFDGKLVDRYLADGDESHFDRIAMFGYRGADRTDRVDEPSGLLKQDPEAYPTAEFKAHHLRLARVLRRLSEGREPGTSRLRYFGFDIDASPSSGYEYIGELLRDSPSSPALDSLRGALARVNGESLDDEVRRLDGVLALLEERHDTIERQKDAAWIDELRYCVLSLRDNLDYARVAYPATAWDGVAQAMAMRERIMQRHVRRALEQAPPGEGFVLMAHNMHLAKDDERIRAPGIGPGGGKERSVGTWLNRRLPNQALSVWMLFERGNDNQPFAGLPTRLSSPPTSVNALLGRAGEVFALPARADDARAAVLAKEGDVLMLYNQVARLEPAAQADIVFFVREVTPLSAD